MLFGNTSRFCCLVEVATTHGILSGSKTISKSAPMGFIGFSHRLRGAKKNKRAPLRCARACGARKEFLHPLPSTYPFSAQARLGPYWANLWPRLRRWIVKWCKISCGSRKALWWRQELKAHSIEALQPLAISLWLLAWCLSCGHSSGPNVFNIRRRGLLHPSKPKSGLTGDPAACARKIWKISGRSTGRSACATQT